MFIDWLVELKDQIDRHGVRWGVVFTLYAVYRKERRNYRLDRRDEVHNAYFAAILHNQQIIMKQLGVGEEWSAGTLEVYENSNPVIKELLQSWSIIKSCALFVVKFILSNLRRIPMLSILTSSGARKVAYFLIASGVTYLNQKLGFNLNADDLFIVWGLALTLIQHDAHFNLKKFVSSAVTSLSGSAQSATTSTTGTPIETVTAPPMTQEEAKKILQELSDELKPIYDALNSGRGTQAAQQGFQLAAQALELIKQNKGA
jgi:hypothetical protein